MNASKFFLQQRSMIHHLIFKMAVYKEHKKYDKHVFFLSLNTFKEILESLFHHRNYLILQKGKFFRILQHKEFFIPFTYLNKKFLSFFV